MLPQHLPRLPFGNDDSVMDHSLDALRCKISKAVPGNFSIDRLSNQGEFGHAVSSTGFGKLTLTAIAVTPVRVSRESETKRTIVIPFSGEISIAVNHKTYHGHPRRTGVFCSGIPRVGSMSGHFSELLVELDDAYLNEVADGMFGPEFKWNKDALRLDQDRELELDINGISFDSLIRNNCRNVDSLRGKTEAKVMLGLDNVFYRAFVGLLAPKLVFGDVSKTSGTKSGDGSIIRCVCDYIQDHLEHPITLTELEQLAGISARRLQYVFLHRFGCSPTEWIRKERLTLAHDQLVSPVEGVNVTSVAHAAGFNHMGAFAAQYRARFGESPSITLKKALEK
jgi:AraC-like DNA-binding protein